METDRKKTKEPDGKLELLGLLEMARQQRLELERTTTAIENKVIYQGAEADDAGDWVGDVIYGEPSENSATNNLKILTDRLRLKF